MWCRIFPRRTLNRSFKRIRQLPGPRYVWSRHNIEPPPAESSPKTTTTSQAQRRSRESEAQSNKLAIMDAQSFSYMPTPYGYIYPQLYNPPFYEQMGENAMDRYNFRPKTLQARAEPALRSVTDSSFSYPDGPSPTPQSRPRPRGRRPSAGRDKKVQPSAESGGVPDPTPEYLEASSMPPFMLPYPRKILVVVDLNGTLLFRPSRRDPTRIIPRPHAKEFLGYCINTFVVAIWSSAMPHNVDKMLRKLDLTPQDRQQIVAVWGRDKFGLSDSDSKLRVQCYKRLSALWAAPEVAAAHPDAATGGRWSQKDTVLIDDTIEKARTEPHNLIEIPEFEGDHSKSTYVIPQVHDYINHLSQQANISAYIRTSPFRPKSDFILGQETAQQKSVPQEPA
ncbi:HAD-like domain-containing protein [Xylariomycetidae sp. FL2044]|nr:HAD-like domain-containing protein [Xylariomycetidae sp. FL2044]